MTTASTASATVTSTTTTFTRVTTTTTSTMSPANIIATSDNDATATMLNATTSMDSYMPESAPGTAATTTATVMMMMPSSRLDRMSAMSDGSNKRMSCNSQGQQVVLDPTLPPSHPTRRVSQYTTLSDLDDVLKDESLQDLIKLNGDEADQEEQDGDADGDENTQDSRQRSGTLKSAANITDHLDHGNINSKAKEGETDNDTKTMATMSTAATPSPGSDRSKPTNGTAGAANDMHRSMSSFDQRWRQNSPHAHDERPAMPRIPRRNSFGETIVAEPTGNNEVETSRSDPASVQPRHRSWKEDSAPFFASPRRPSRSRTIGEQQEPQPQQQRNSLSSPADDVPPHSSNDRRNNDNGGAPPPPPFLLSNHQPKTRRPYQLFSDINDATSTIPDNEDHLDDDTFLSEEEDQHTTGRYSASGGSNSSRRRAKEAGNKGENPGAIQLLTKNRIRALLVDMYDDCRALSDRVNGNVGACKTCSKYMSPEQKEECWNVFFDKYYKPGFVWIRASGNPIHQEGLVQMFTRDLEGVQFTLVSVDSIRIMGGGHVAIVDYTADQIFTYKGKYNADRTVVSCAMEIINGEILIAHEHRCPGRPIPTATRWE